MAKEQAPRRDLVVSLAGMFVCVAIALGVVVSAHAAWDSVVTLSDPGQNANVPQVAVDPNGNAVFVWTRADGTTDCSGNACMRIQARSRSAGGVLGPVETLSAAGSNADRPQVAVDQGGNAVFVWQRRDPAISCSSGGCPVEARVRSATGTLSTTEVLSDSNGGSGPQVAVDPNGNAVIAWFGGGVVQARARSAAGVLSAIQTLSEPGQTYNGLDVGIDENANALFTWLRYDGTAGCRGTPLGCIRVQARARSGTGTLGAIETLSAGGVDSYESHVAVDHSGDAVFAWALLDQAGCSCIRVKARARSAAGALSATQTLSATGASATSSQVGIDQNGNAVFVWNRPDSTTDCGGSGCSRTQTRARSAAGSLSAIQTLTPGHRHSSFPQLAVDPNGNAVFVWIRPDKTSTCGGPCLRVQGRARSAAGSLTPTETISGPTGHTQVPQVAVDSNGGAVAVWRQLAVIWRIKAASGP